MKTQIHITLEGHQAEAWNKAKGDAKNVHFFKQIFKEYLEKHREELKISNREFYSFMPTEEILKYVN